jgi:hypothetical protein
MNKPTEEDILLIKDKRDPYYKEALEHASALMGLKDIENHENSRKSHRKQRK